MHGFALEKAGGYLAARLHVKSELTWNSESVHCGLRARLV